MSIQYDLHRVQGNVNGSSLAEQLVNWCDRLYFETSSVESTCQLFHDIYNVVHFAAHPNAFEEFDERLSILFDTGEYDAWYLATDAS